MHTVPRTLTIWAMTVGNHLFDLNYFTAGGVAFDMPRRGFHNDTRDDEMNIFGSGIMI